MKVIVAGYPKTGTKTLNAALSELGYNIYDYLESFHYHYEAWNRIYSGKGSKADFANMYTNIDAVVDHPGFHFWKEIHEAFPDSKIILMTRDEESWFKSFKNQMDELTNAAYTWRAIYCSAMSAFIPTYRKFMQYNDTSAVELTGRPRTQKYFGLVQLIVVDKLNALLRYRKHNAYMLQEAPKDKLLVYNVKDGWEPLCKFLEKEIPSTPFPHKNIGGKDIIRNLDRHAVWKQIEKETNYTFIGFILVFMLIGSAYFFTDISMWQVLFSVFVCYVIVRSLLCS